MVLSGIITKPILKSLVKLYVSDLRCVLETLPQFYDLGLTEVT